MHFSLSRCCPLPPESFESLLKLIGPVTAKQTTRLCESIPAEIQLAVTLRYLASDEAQQPLAWSWSTWMNYRFKDYTRNMPSYMGDFVSNLSKISRYRGGMDKDFHQF